MEKILLIVLGVILFGNFELQAKASSVDYAIIVQKEINKLKSVKENNKELYELFKNNLGKLEFARKEIEKVRNEGLRNEFKTIFTEINKLKMKTYPSTLLNVELWDIDDFVDKNEEVFSDYKELSKMKTNITYLITIIDSILKYKKSEVKNNSGNILKGILKDIILEKIGEYNNKKNKELYCDNCKKENLIENKINKKAAEINKNLTEVENKINKVKTNLKDSDKIKKLNDLLKNKIEKEVKAKNENSEEIKNNEDNKNYIKRIKKRITEIELIIQKINAEKIDSINNINNKIDSINKLFKFNIESIDTKIIDNKNEYFNKIKEVLNLKGKEIKEIKLSSSLKEVKNNINSNNNAIIKEINGIIIEISDKKVSDLNDTYNIVNISRYISDLIILLDVIKEYNVLQDNKKIKGKTIKTVEGIENLKDFLFKLKFQYRTLLKSIEYIENIKKGDLNSKTLISDSKNAKNSVGENISERKTQYAKEDKVNTSKGGSEIIVSAFANFMIKRAKEEVYIMFMDLLGSKKDDFLTVFPSLVSQFGENKNNFSGGSLKSSLVYAMEEDLKSLPINIFKIDSPFIDKTLIKNANLLFTFINNLKKGFHPNEIFEILINTDNGKYIISRNKGFKFSLKLISFISSEFYNNKTNKWLSINEFNQLDMDAQKYFITLVRNNFYKEFKEKFEKKFRKKIEEKLREEFNKMTKDVYSN